MVNTARHGSTGRGLAVLTLACVAFSFQQTMVVPALPALQLHFHTTAAWVTWLATGFFVSAAVAVPLFGKLGDEYGKKRMLVICMSVFLVGSVGAAVSWNLPTLIGCRMIQGCCAAVFPLSFALIKDEFPPEKVPFGIGLVSSAFGIGGGIGLALSGVILDQLGWRYLFVIGGVPVAFAVVFVHKLISESTIKTPARMDLAGAALLSGALICLLLGLTEGNMWGWSSAPITGLLAGSAVLSLAWGWVERHVAEPMVDLKMLAHRTVLFTNIVTLVALVGIFAVWVLIPNFVSMPNGLPADTARLVDYGFGSSSTEAGLYLLPGALAGMFTGPVGARFGQRYGAKVALLASMGISVVGLAMLAVWHDRPWQVIAAITLYGAGIPVLFAAVATLVVDAVRATETGVATAVNTVMRMIGAVIGGQAAIAILTADTIPGTDVPSEDGFAWVLRGAAGLTLVSLVLAVAMIPRQRGAARIPIAEGAH